MDRSSKKIIVAVVNTYDETIVPWETLGGGSFYTRLFSGTGDAQIGSVMRAAISPLSDEIIKETAADTLRAFVENEDGFVLGGGLFFKENGEIQVAPGCCGGLEDWGDWFAVANGKTDIWTGHDPQSLVEIDDGVIKIWNNREARNESPSIELTVDEMNGQLENVERDLRNFLYRLEQWTKYIAPGLEKQVAGHFAKNMRIGV